MAGFASFSLKSIMFPSCTRQVNLPIMVYNILNFNLIVRKAKYASTPIQTHHTSGAGSICSFSDSGM
jgi:hypothetical protein